MNNSKWLKLFRILAKDNVRVKKCIVTDIFNHPGELELPTIETFDATFSKTGIKDVMSGGPLLFKEILHLELPSHWLMKKETAEMCDYQGLDFLEQKIRQIGKLSIERDETSLKIFGYK